MGLPTLYEEYFLESVFFMAKPKSAILIYWFLRKMLAGLRSRWMIPFLEMLL